MLLNMPLFWGDEKYKKTAANIATIINAAQILLKAITCFYDVNKTTVFINTKD